MVNMPTSISLIWQVMLVEFKKSRPWTVVFSHGRFRLSHSPLLWILWLKIRTVRKKNIIPAITRIVVGSDLNSTSGKSLWVGACNSTIFLWRRFHRQIYFYIEFPGTRLPWECHDQSQETDWRHWVTGPELSFFHKRRGILKIDQSVKMPRHRFSMGVA